MGRPRRDARLLRRAQPGRCAALGVPRTPSAGLLVPARHFRLSGSRVPMSYAELHCLTNFSFLRGASHPEELVERAVELGYAALAITDECSVAGVVRAHVAAREQSLPLIVGSEFRLEDGLRLVLLATSREGYGQLCRLITRARRAAIKGSYRLTRDDLRTTDTTATRRLWRSTTVSRSGCPVRRPARRMVAGWPACSRIDCGSRSSCSRAARTAAGSPRSRRWGASSACRSSRRATCTCMYAAAARCRTCSPLRVCAPPSSARAGAVSQRRAPPPSAAAAARDLSGRS